MSRRKDGPGYTINNNVWPGLAKVVEECSEVVQVLAKIMSRFGNTDYYDGTDLRRHLEEELGDLKATIKFLEKENHLDKAFIRARKREKLAKFYGWKKSNQ